MIPPTRAETLFAFTSLAKPSENTGPSPNVGIQLGIRPIVRPNATCSGLDLSRNRRIKVYLILRVIFICVDPFQVP